jgi:acetyl-CoA acetyltransferase
MARLPEKQVCVTGAAQTAIGRPSPRSALELTLDAARGALADAGLSVADLDGIATYPGKSAEGGGIAPVGTTEAAFALGMTPRWVLSSAEGHSHLGAVFGAIAAIATGLARHVLIFRTVAQASARAKARSATLLSGGRPGRVEGNNAWALPFNALSPVNIFALYAQAYFDRYGATSAQLGALAVNARAHAARNPNALFRAPLTLDDYLASRMISTPLRLLDCDSHIDGATAIVLSHRDAARDLRRPPLHIEAIGMALGGLGAGLHEPDFLSIGAERAGQMLWQRTDMTRESLSCAQIYDGFSIHTWLWMEALGLVGPGEAAAFVEGGARIALDGQLPLNTGGGQLSGGRWHGYGHVHEACVQLWGQGEERQVAGAQSCLVACGGYGFGAMILRRD